ncbi:MAG: hypothetical protein IJJ50_05550 [Lachnospiraceae bacterium]|nr:hypothetical protein [Lachnospiraceae bacterium]
MNVFYLIDKKKWETRMEAGFEYSPAFLPGILSRAGIFAREIDPEETGKLTKDDLLLIGADITDTVPENAGALILLGGLVGAEARKADDAGKPGRETADEKDSGEGGRKEETNPVTNLADCDGDCSSCGGSCGDDEDSGPDPKVYEILLRTRPRGKVRARYMTDAAMLSLGVPVLPVAGTFQPMRMAVCVDQNGFETSAPALIWRGDLFFDFRFDVAQAMHFAALAGDAETGKALAADLLRVLRMCGIPVFYEESAAMSSGIRPAEMSLIAAYEKDGVLRISTERTVFARVPGSPEKAYLDGAEETMSVRVYDGEEIRGIRIPAGQHRVSWM